MTADCGSTACRNPRLIEHTRQHYAGKARIAPHSSRAWWPATRAGADLPAPAARADATRKRLLRVGRRAAARLFPTDSTVSVLYVMSDGAAAEISVVGNDASCVVMNSCFVDDRHEDAEARLWPQTERIKASCMAAEATGAFISRPSELSRREVTRWDPRVQGEAGTLAVPVLHRPSLFRTWTGLRECQARSTCRAKRSRCSSRTSVNVSPVAAAIALSTGCRGSAGMRS